MNLNIDSLLLERMAEGVFFLNEEGQITDFNRASRRWLPCCAIVAPQLGQLTKQIASGAVLAPADVTALFQPWTTADPVDVYLCKSDPHGYALVFLPLQRQTSGAVPNGRSEGHVFALLGEELRHEMTVLRGHLARLSLGHMSDIDTVICQSDRLSKHLVAMGQLSQLSDRNTLFQDSRLFLSDLIDEVLTEVPLRKGGYLVKPRPVDLPVKQGMLYGDAGWLKCALRELLLGIGEKAPLDSQIRLHVRENGGFVIFRGSFTQSVRAKRAARLEPARLQTASSQQDIDIRLPVCWRIVKLYGGQLEITHTHDDNAGEQPTGFDAFVMTLPLGDSAPPGNDSTCVNSLFFKQAELYAKDLALLMPSRRLSPDVLQNVSDFKNEAEAGLVSNLLSESLN